MLLSPQASKGGDLYSNIIIGLSNLYIHCAILKSAETTVAIDVAHNTTTRLSCRGRVPFPVWYLNETLVPSPQYTVGYDPSTGDYLGILMIDGNVTCGTLDIRCAVEGLTIFSTSITVQGLQLLLLCVCKLILNHTVI